jgi:uncharacterized RDD family membrane protein YckC
MESSLMATTIPPTPSAADFGAAPTPRYRGFWIRFVGRIIDAIIVVGLTFAVLKATGAVTVTCPADTIDVTTSCPGGVTSISPILWVVVAIALLYYPVLWGLGGSLGHRVLGMRVVDATTGKFIGIPRGLLRGIGYIIAGIPIGLGLMWAGWDSRKQGWHDKIAGTVVVGK